MDGRTVSKMKFVGIMTLVAFVAGIFYFIENSSEGSRPSIESASDMPAHTESEKNSSKSASDLRADTASVAIGAPTNAALRTATASPVPSDPRLAALMVSQDNGNLEFVVGPDGKVVKEIDKNPSSPNFKKPLREYTYSGDSVIGLTAYQYLADYIQITETRVSYKPDGSVDQYRESTNYVYPKRKSVSIK